MNTRVRAVHLLVIPLAGMAVFIVLYFVAAHAYPGGSQANPYREGFDWLNNYWCDLIARSGKNGQSNPARPVALTAMIVLFSSLSVFWFILPGFFRESRFSRLLIGYTGVVSMLVLVFVFTEHHDAVILTGGTISAVPFAGTLRELYINRWRFLFLFGCFCLAIILLNFYIYLSGWLLSLLPLIQKITMVFFIGWITLVELSCIRRLRRTYLKIADGKSQLSV
jgi:hypothetical protein